MATFPPLAPSTRVYSPGDVPQSAQFSIAGQQTRFRQGNRRIAQSLALSFNYINETDMELLKTHYFDSEGTFEIFFLSPEIWSGYVTPPVALLSDFGWHYVSAPSITDVTCDRFSVEINLETIPIDTGDLVYDAELAPASPAREYILESNGAAVSPARDFIIAPTGAA